MKKLKMLALKYDAIAYIYFGGMMAVAVMPLAMLYLLLYAVGCK